MFKKKQYSSDEIVQRVFPKGSIMFADFRGKTMFSFTLDDCPIIRTNFSNTKFIKGSLHRTRFAECVFSEETLFQGVDFTGAIFQNCTIDGKPIPEDLKEKDLIGEPLTLEWLREHFGQTNTGVESCSIEPLPKPDVAYQTESKKIGKLLFPGGLVSGFSFQKAILPRCTFDRQTIFNVNFQDTNLTDGSFIESSFIECDFSAQTIFKNANLRGAAFRDCMVDDKPITREWLAKHSPRNLDSCTITPDIKPEPIAAPAPQTEQEQPKRTFGGLKRGFLG